MSPDAYAIHTGWIEVLDTMEAGLEADRMLIDRDILPEHTTNWEPPQHLGPIPIELRERAARVLADLGESSRKLSALKDATGQQLNAVRSIPSVRSDASVYLDVAG